MKAMRVVRVTRKSDGLCIAERVREASGMFARLKGLLGESHLNSSEGILLTPCNSVHTWFMKFAIDVVYVAKDLRVLKIHRDMRPWKLDFPVWGARAALEVASGGAQALKEGDYLCIS